MEGEKLSDGRSFNPLVPVSGGFLA